MSNHHVSANMAQEANFARSGEGFAQQLDITSRQSVGEWPATSVNS